MGVTPTICPNCKKPIDPFGKVWVRDGKFYHIWCEPKPSNK